MIEGLADVLTPILLALSGICVAALAALNARDRRAEIGVHLALGFGVGRILFLVLGRAAWLGALAGALGAGLGWWVARAAGPSWFVLEKSAIVWDGGLLGLAVVLTPVFAVLASLVPATLAATADPAEVMQER